MQQSLQNIDSDWQEELETEVRAELTVSLTGKFSGLSINYISRLDTVTVLLSFSLIVVSLQSDSLVVLWRKQHNCIELR